MSQDLDPRAGFRLQIVCKFFLLYLVFLLAHLVSMQIFGHSAYTDLAKRQQERRHDLKPLRGMILDRNGERLALTLPGEGLGVHPDKIVSVTTAATILSRVLGKDYDSLYSLLEENRQKGRRFLWIQRLLTPEQAESLKKLKFDWLAILSRGQRFYPNGSLAAHVLGGVTLVDQHGAGGVEWKFEELLAGRAGEEKMLVNSRGNRLGVVEYIPPVPPADLTLTIDYMLQSEVEKALEEAVQTTDCKAGAVVVMDPHTGDILAMASYPTFDPNEPPVLDSQEPFSPYLNRALSEPIEPGSVMKMVTVSAALETTTLTPESIINCTSYSRPGRTIGDVHHYGALSVADVIAKSSNVGAVKIGLQVGARNLYDYLLRFGFGKPTGVTLPGENIGLLSNVSKWRLDTLESASIGHAVSANVLQMARAVAVIANDGYLVTPRIIKSVYRPDRGAFELPAGRRVRVLKPETALTMRRLMERVVLEGTGKRARIAGFTAGGKTGSAEIYDRATGRYLKNQNIGNFVGFAPVTQPKIAVAVSLYPTRHFGGTVAAPVFQKAAAGALRRLDVPPDALPMLAEARMGPGESDAAEGGGMSGWAPEAAGEPESAVAGIPSLLPAVGFGSAPTVLVGPRVPDFRGKTLRQVLEQSAELGLTVEYAGSGLARSQTPQAGEPVPPGGHVLVLFAR